VIEGVTYAIDLSQPAMFDPDGAVLHPDAQRITDLAFQGRPVTDEMQFIIATNDYRASGGGASPGAGGDTIVLEAPDTNRDVVIQHFLERRVVDVSKEPGWSFARMPGTTVLFPTGPGARPHAADVRGVRLEDAGDPADGFALFRITL
jgi:2',3'-cyclic-nucleotide 2'-phosphodiesterase/3'-nucleotidase